MQRVAGEHLFTPDGQRYFDWAFVYIFAGYMIEDLVLHRCAPIMLAHHVACLLGLAFAFVGVPAGFPWFLAGAVSLELGSAALNLHCLSPTDRRALFVYTVAMTLSNAVAALSLARWVGLTAHWGSATVGVTISAAFLYFRQKDVFEAVGSQLRAKPKAATAMAKAHAH